MQFLRWFPSGNLNSTVPESRHPFHEELASVHRKIRFKIYQNDWENDIRVKEHSKWRQTLYAHVNTLKILNQSTIDFSNEVTLGLNDTNVQVYGNHKLLLMRPERPSQRQAHTSCIVTLYFRKHVTLWALCHVHRFTPVTQARCH